MSNLFPTNPDSDKPQPPKTYAYFDTSGMPLFQVCRYEP